ncbi:hypothetical protein [Burkholderia ubonensis]|uniref:hypothetical protein n=1 Tax=Burkholderia ubonensis TaxID=101571 RepID=UPI001E2A554D|nr:hypothetical protein [Burkholderia ubonensis]
MNRKLNIEIIKNKQPPPATRPRLSLTFYPIKAHQTANPLPVASQKITIRQKCVTEQHQTCLIPNSDNGHPIAFTHIKPSPESRALQTYPSQHITSITPDYTAVKQTAQPLQETSTPLNKVAHHSTSTNIP